MENNKGTMSKMKICSLIAEACFFILGVTVSLFSITNLDFMGDYCIGSGFLPFWYGLLIAVMAVFLIINTLRGKYDNSKSVLPDREELRNMLVLLAIVIGTIIFMPTLGMNICIFIYLLLTMKLVEKQPWKLTILTAVIGTIVLYLVFAVAFKINFPVGILGF